MFGQFERHTSLELPGLESTSVLSHPFFELRKYAQWQSGNRAPVLIVPPLSGHCSWLVRDVVASLAADGPVHLLDWANPRFVPITAGDFDLEASFKAVSAAMDHIGEGVSVIGICQSVVPVLMAAGRCAHDPDRPPPKSVVLIGGPVDPFASRTASTSWGQYLSKPFLKALQVQVPLFYPGAGRRVFPVTLRASALLAYAAAHLSRPDPFAESMTRAFSAAPPFIPFAELFFTLVDLHGTWLCETVDAVYGGSERCGLWTEPWVRDASLADTCILTIEGELDDVAAPGQTSAALDLCGEGDGRREAVVVPDAGHFDLFHGHIWRRQVAPIVLEFLAR